MPATVTTPGNAVVSLSSVLDELRGLLTTQEIDEVIAAVAPSRRSAVGPGDLITAALFNQILSDVADLQSRVATLEGDKGIPVLSGRAPSGDIGLLGFLTLFGTGFDPTLSNNLVQLGGVTITTFVGDQNSSNQLSFQVPDQFPGVPQVVDLTVTSGGRTSNPLQVRLLPKVQRQAGPMLVLSRTAPLAAVVAGQPLALQWLIDPQLSDTYSFRLLFFDVAGASEAGWRGGSTIAPVSPQPITNANPLPVVATIMVPVGAANTQVALEVTSSDGTKARTSDPMVLAVGQLPQVTDPRALVSVRTTDLTSTGPLRNARVTTGAVELDGLQLVFGATADVPINVFATAQAGAAGDYSYSAQVESGPWRVVQVVPASNSAVPASQNRQIAVTLQNTDTARSAAVAYLVVRAAHQISGTTDFTAFARIPIQGVAA